VETNSHMMSLNNNSEIKTALESLRKGLPSGLEELPPTVAGTVLDGSVSHAPKRLHRLTEKEQKLALKNALRYFPSILHPILAPEFLEEFRTEGHIYMRRFRPTNYPMKAHPIDSYPAKCQQGLFSFVSLFVCFVLFWQSLSKGLIVLQHPHTPIARAIMLMIQNNLDPLVAQYPHELITYGGNGAVFQNWYHS
jgi:urocanate hydratase